MANVKDIIELLADSEGEYSMPELEAAVEELKGRLAGASLPAVPSSSKYAELMQAARAAAMMAAVQSNVMHSVIDAHQRLKEKESGNRNSIKLYIYPWGFDSWQETPVLHKAEHEIHGRWA